jgi:hypothetical protein
VSAIRVNLLVKTNQANKEGVAPAFSALQLGDPEMADYVASGSDAKRSHILVERIIPVVNNARDQ